MQLKSIDKYIQFTEKKYSQQYWKKTKSMDYNVET